MRLDAGYQDNPFFQRTAFKGQNSLKCLLIIGITPETPNRFRRVGNYTTGFESIYRFGNVYLAQANTCFFMMIKSCVGLYIRFR